MEYAVSGSQARFRIDVTKFGYSTSDKMLFINDLLLGNIAREELLSRVKTAQDDTALAVYRPLAQQCQQPQLDRGQIKGVFVGVMYSDKNNKHESDQEGVYMVPIDSNLNGKCAASNRPEITVDKLYECIRKSGRKQVNGVLNYTNRISTLSLHDDKLRFHRPRRRQTQCIEPGTVSKLREKFSQTSSEGLGTSGYENPHSLCSGADEDRRCCLSPSVSNRSQNSELPNEALYQSINDSKNSQTSISYGSCDEIPVLEETYNKLNISRHDQRKTRVDLRNGELHKDSTHRKLRLPGQVRKNRNVDFRADGHRTVTKTVHRNLKSMCCKNKIENPRDHKTAPGSQSCHSSKKPSTQKRRHSTTSRSAKMGKERVCSAYNTAEPEWESESNKSRNHDPSKEPIYCWELYSALNQSPTKTDMKSPEPRHRSNDSSGLHSENQSRSHSTPGMWSQTKQVTKGNENISAHGGHCYRQQRNRVVSGNGPVEKQDRRSSQQSVQFHFPNSEVTMSRKAAKSKARDSSPVYLSLSSPQKRDALRASGTVPFKTLEEFYESSSDSSSSSGPNRSRKNRWEATNHAHAKVADPRSVNAHAKVAHPRSFEARYYFDRPNHDNGREQCDTSHLQPDEHLTPLHSRHVEVVSPRYGSQFGPVQLKPEMSVSIGRSNERQPFATSHRNCPSLSEGNLPQQDAHLSSAEGFQYRTHQMPSSRPCYPDRHTSDNCLNFHGQQQPCQAYGYQMPQLTCSSKVLRIGRNHQKSSSGVIKHAIGSTSDSSEAGKQQRNVARRPKQSRSFQHKRLSHVERRPSSDTTSTDSDLEAKRRCDMREKQLQTLEEEKYISRERVTSEMRCEDDRRKSNRNARINERFENGPMLDQSVQEVDELHGIRKAVFEQRAVDNVQLGTRVDVPTSNTKVSLGQPRRAGEWHQRHNVLPPDRNADYARNPRALGRSSGDYEKFDSSSDRLQVEDDGRSASRTSFGRSGRNGKKTHSALSKSTYDDIRKDVNERKDELGDLDFEELKRENKNWQSLRRRSHSAPRERAEPEYVSATTQTAKMKEYNERARRCSLSAKETGKIPPHIVQATRKLKSSRGIPVNSAGTFSRGNSNKRAVTELLNESASARRHSKIRSRKSEQDSDSGKPLEKHSIQRSRSTDYLDQSQEEKLHDALHRAHPSTESVKSAILCPNTLTCREWKISGP